MVRKSAISVLSIFVFLSVATFASANVLTVQPGGKAVCENASWVIYNLSETDVTDVVFNVGPIAYGWGKDVTRHLEPGGFQANALARRTTFQNKGPGAVSINCQRKRGDAHDWKIDPGSGKTYQSNYHMDHVRPQTYIEPGLGLEEGHERGLRSVLGDRKERDR